MTVDQRGVAPGRFIRGLLFGLVILGASLFGRAWMLDNVAVNFVAQVALPVAVFLYFTRDLLDTFTLLTVSEICLNGVSSFLEHFDLPGARSYVLVATLALTGIYYLSRRGAMRPFVGYSSPGTSRLVLFFGLLYPCVLVGYSVLFRETSLNRAVWDVAFIAPLLLYWPVLRLMRRDRGFFMGMMIAMTVVLSVVAYIVSLSPVGVSARIMANLGADEDVFVAGLYMGRQMGYTMTQGALPTFIITFIGFYFGLLRAADPTKAFRSRLSAALLAVLCIGHVVLDYIRGPVLGTIGISALAMGAMAMRVSTRAVAFRMAGFLSVVAAAFIVIMSVFNPVGLERYVRNIDSPSEYMGGARREIGAVMLEAFRERPLMGHGVGMPPTGYLRDEGQGPLNFELQYHLVLYRVGLVGFTIFMLPLAWLYYQLIDPRGALIGAALFTVQGQFRCALLLSALTITVAGATNPYLKTGYNMMIIMFFWAYTQHLKEQGFFSGLAGAR